jgi:hypothetical protein
MQKILFCLLIIFSPLFFAAQDGTKGPVSTGNLTVSLLVLPQAQTQYLTDLALNLAEHNDFATQTTEVSACVYGGSQGGGYFLTAYDGDSDFNNRYEVAESSRLLNNKNNLPVFEISARDNPHTFSYYLSAKDYNDLRFRSIVPSVPLYLNGATTPDCANKRNLDIQLTLDKDAQPIKSEQYNDTVFVTISPQ